MGCSHSYSFYVDDRWEDDYGNIHNNSRLETESTFVDLDLHRYQCSTCKEIFYYSGAAKAYHEDGIKTDIEGLDK